ncbi:MAG: OmpH family outer membrane protein [Polymorphobacter sp.]|uniref:OmpH family outer membrane protein n=1 Tax=Polymorphobacter sp. TaxID=1909290 RepID=UPI003A8957DB
MKKILISLALASAATLAPVASPAFSQTLPAAVVIVVDLDKIYRDSAAAKAATVDLKSKDDALRARASQLQSSLGAEQQQLAQSRPAQGAPAATVTAWETKARDFQARQQQAGQELEKRQSDLQAARQFVLKQINDALQPIITTVMRERGASVAIAKGATLDSTSALDMTNDIMARLDRALPRVSTTPPATPGR